MAPDLLSKNCLFNRKNDLHVFGSKGFDNWFDTIEKIIKTKPRPHTFKIKINQYQKEQIFKGIKVQTIKGNHSDSSVILKFFDEKKNFVYVSDTDYDENIFKFANETDLLILECSWPDKYKQRGHLTPSECGQIAMKSCAKKLLLTHFYPPMEKIDIKKSVQRFYKGPIVLAKDLMEIEI